MLLACAWLGTAADASAQAGDAAPATDEGGDAYRRVIEDALQEFNLGNWDEAAVLFERAHGINPSARTRRGMGMAAFEARHYVAAIAHLSAALDETRHPLTTTQRAEVQRTLSRAHDYVARLALALHPRGARVRINGHEVEPDGRGDRLSEPGLLELVVSADGYEPLVRRIQAAAGKRQSLEVKLQRIGLPHATTAPGTAGLANERASGAARTWKWVLGASGVVALAAGGAALIVQKAEASRYNAMCDPDKLTESCASIQRDAGGLWYVGSIAGIGVGAALLSASALLFVLDRPQAEAERAQQSGCQIGFADLGVTCRLVL